MSERSYHQIIAACFPDLPIASCVFLAQGWDSVAVLVNGDLVFRLPKRPAIEQMYRKEARLLPLLASALELAVPRFDFFWPGGAAYPHTFAGYPLIAGQPLRAELLRSIPAAPIAAQIGRALGRLHRFPAERAAAAGVPGGDAEAWRAGYRRMYAQVKARVLPLLQRSEQTQVAERWSAYLDESANFQFQPALIHRDLSTEHILIDPERQRVAGIIDWGDAAIGDPALDFTGLYAGLGPQFMEDALAGYGSPPDPALRERAIFYTFVIPFHAILFGQSTNSPPHIGEGLAQLRATLDR